MKRFSIYIFCLAALCIQGVANAQGTIYSDLPIERRMLFNGWEGTDYGTYFSPDWKHEGSVMFPPFIPDSKSLLAGTNHLHQSGWQVSHGRTGQPRNNYILPQCYDAQNTVTNYQVAVQSSTNATITTPILKDGAGYFYFDVQTPAKAVDCVVEICTNRADLSGNTFELDDSRGSEIWYPVQNFSFDKEQFFRNKVKILYPGAIRLRLRRASIYNDNLDTNFLQVDNLCVSRPTSLVQFSKPIIAKVPGNSTSMQVSCEISNFPNISSSDHLGRTLHLYYAVDGAEQGEPIEMDYVPGSGDGQGNGEKYQAILSFHKDATFVKTYYVCKVEGDRYLPIDYTNQGGKYWDGDGAEPNPEFRSREVDTDVSGWDLTRASSEMSIERKMLFNFWNEEEGGSLKTVDYGNYFSKEWVHIGGVMFPPFIPDSKSLFAGTEHTHSSGWTINEGRTGAPREDYVPPQYWDGVAATNWMVSLRDEIGAGITSPFYTNGIGTIYFDTRKNRNSRDQILLSVEIATNMVDEIVSHDIPTNVMYETEFAVTNSITGEVDHHYRYNWQSVATVEPIPASEGVLHFQKTLLYRDKIRMRIRRITSKTGGDTLFAFVDNIQVSIPPADVSIREDDVPFEPPYPAPEKSFKIRCRVDNVDQEVPTTHRERLVIAYFRWRYLDQHVDEWQELQMTYVPGAAGDDGQGNGELYEVTLPPVPREGDLEYYFTCDFDGYCYRPVDYTLTDYEYWPDALHKGTESLSPKVYRAETGKKEFSLRVRRAASNYREVNIVTDSHADPIPMHLMNDEKWWGWIPLNVETNRISTFKFQFRGLGGFDSQKVTISTNEVCWAEVGQGMAATPPSGGICREATTNDWMAVSGVDDARYVLAKLDLQTMNYTICRADYQNFDNWVAFEEYFSESDGQSTKLDYSTSFQNWDLSAPESFKLNFIDNKSEIKNPVFNVGFETLVPNWYARSASYIYERVPANAENRPEGVQNAQNISIRLMGANALINNPQGLTELGSVSTTGRTLTDGLEKLSFKARVANSIDPTKMAFYNQYFGNKLYLVQAILNRGDFSPETHSVSLCAYYKDDGNFYEFRIVQVPNLANLSDDRLLWLELHKWDNGIDNFLARAVVKGIRIGGQLTQLDMSSGTSIVGSFGGYKVTANLIYSTSAGGTVGFMSSNCQLDAQQVKIVPKFGTTVIPSIDEESWSLRNKAFRIEGGRLRSVVPSQRIGIYVQKTTYSPDHDGDDPQSSLSHWEKRQEILLSSYAYKYFEYVPKDWQPEFVRLQVLNDGYDVALDELATYSWHGKNYQPEGALSEQWSMTEGWVIPAAQNSATDRILQFDMSRSNPGKEPVLARGQTQGLCSPLLLNGSGSIEMDYRVVKAPVKLTVQWQPQFSPGEWRDVRSVVINERSDEWKHISFYAGNTNAGYLRVVNDRRGGEKNDQFIYHDSFFEVRNITAWDEPFVDTASWQVYNAKITALDTSRVILDESRGCFLNNDPENETKPVQDQFKPFLQAPLLLGGLGEISFDARLYDDTDPVEEGNLYIMVKEDDDWYATNGWRVVETIKIDTPYYKNYRYNIGQGGEKYKGVKLVTGWKDEKRVCIENVSVSEPVYPGFDITSTRPICQKDDFSYRDDEEQQPLDSDKIGIEARLSNLRMSPTNINVFVDYYVGTDVWGVTNWYAKRRGTLPMYPTPEDPQIYRTSTDNDIGFLERDEIVQYRVWASYTDESGATHYNKKQEKSGFENPSWYEPLNMNRKYAAQGWSPYFIVYGVPKGVVFINEVNVYEAESVFDDPKTKNFYIPYVEIAVPETMTLDGWKLDFITGDRMQTTNTFDFYKVPQKKAVTNGYAFYTVSVDEIYAKTMLRIPLPGYVDYQVYGLLQQQMITSYGLNGLVLRRPMGMVEHSVACYGYQDSAKWGAEWIKYDPLQEMIYVGEEYTPGSLSVMKGNGRTEADWQPLISWTPGLPNINQVMPDIPILFPGVSNVIIEATIDGLGTQNGQSHKLSFKIPRGTSTNIVYEMANWHRLNLLTTNNVNALDMALNNTKVYTLPLENLESNVVIRARVGLAPSVIDMNLLPEVERWLVGFEDAPLQESLYNKNPMSMTELYWFNADPTVKHVITGNILKVEKTPENDFYLTVALTIDGKKCTALYGGATFKIKARPSLTDPKGWQYVSQYAPSEHSFDEEHKCRIYLPNPFETGRLDWEDNGNLFFRWQIEFDEKLDHIREMINTPE